MRKNYPKWPTAVDLFCGCGGVTQGLKHRHYRVVAAVDNDPIACKTYRTNHPRVRLYEEDIRHVDPIQIRQFCLEGKDLDLLVICAPCQPFSSQNRQFGDDDRVRLILDAIAFASVLRPQLILFENVPGLVRERFSPILSDLQRQIEALGFVMSKPMSVDAADYCVPQRRHRCIMIARRGAEPPPLPQPDTPRGQRVFVRHALSGLQDLASGDKDDLDPLHRARKHQPIALERLQHIPKDGGSRDSLPEHLILACHIGHKGHPDVYGRMSWDMVAPTLTTGCTDVTKGRFAHPEADRSITLREAARLQTFPDSYRFAGNASQIATQIGNAVPVQFVESFASEFRSIFGK